MLRTLGRILVQLVLSGPVVFFYPFLLFAAGHTAYDVLARPQAIGPFSLIFVAGALGLTGLYASILLPPGWLARTKAARWTVAFLMALGIVLAIFFLVIGGDASAVGEKGAWMAWTYGGPLVVATWNLWRMFGPKPAPAAQAA